MKSHIKVDKLKNASLFLSCKNLKCGEYDITIGAGGNSVTSTGGTYTGVDGIDGGSSSFGSICSAAEGKGGTYNDGSALYSCGIAGDSTAGDGAKAVTAGSGIANYGGGGAGGSSSSDSGCTSGAGGSGIVIIRNAR